MAVKLTITPETTSVGVTNNVTELTISSAIAGAATDAQGITFQNAARTISTASTVEQALLQLADQFFVQTTAQILKPLLEMFRISCLQREREPNREYFVLSVFFLKPLRTYIRLLVHFQ